VTGTDRGCVLNGRVTSPYRAVLYALPVAMALLAIVLTPTTFSSPGRLAPAGHVVGVTHLTDADMGHLIAPRVTGHQTRTPTWPGWGAGAEPVLLLSGALLASVLLALVGRTRPQGQPYRSFPRRRGPPQLAFTR
jgi:hypothetical protein